MRKIPFAIVTLIFSVFVFASCDTNSSSQDVIHVNSAAAWNNALGSISAAPNGLPGNPAVFGIDITGSFSVNGIEEDGSSITGNYKEVRLTGNGKMSLSGTGSLIQVSANQTFIIDGPTLQGNLVNDAPLVYSISGTVELRSGHITGNKSNGPVGGYGSGVLVDTGGIFTMNGGEISGNMAYDGGGVVVDQGTFTMNNGVISGNTAFYEGGGVYIWDGIFTMNGGNISGNTALYDGGGVIIIDGGIFTMNNGTISGNIASSNGGGVRTDGGFEMKGGVISGNRADSIGGGVFNDGGSFSMTGGTISGNTASSGGGVYDGGSFTMNNAVIYGSDADTPLKNTAGTGASVYKEGNTKENTIYSYP